MSDATTDAATVDKQAPAIRRLLRSFCSTDSYGLVPLMVVATYVAAVSLSPHWGASVVLAAQIGTVWAALHTSHARRRLRVVVNVLFALAGVAAVANLVAGEATDLLTFTFVAGGVLYFIAPFSIVRHIGYRQDVDQETVLGALSAYLIIGMSFAFTYRFLGAVQSTPFFGAQSRRTGPRSPGHRLPHHGVRQPRARRQPRSEPRRARGPDRAAVPGDRRGERRQRLAASGHSPSTSASLGTIPGWTGGGRCFHSKNGAERAVRAWPGAGAPVPSMSRAVTGRECVISPEPLNELASIHAPRMPRS
ncbi:MAG: hypothetical protein ACRD0A_08745 [Acidimicrobiales bacterium]